ncbi:MAG: AI-2E family transporter, partial [Frankiaceae bacterium]|nr:AI-2E family transporter [Frankiaceae bacterium]
AFQAAGVVQTLLLLVLAGGGTGGPVRTLVGRRVRRGLAVAAVTVAPLIGAGTLTYGVVDAVVDQYSALRDTAPGAVADLVDSGPLATADERYDLVQRTTDLVDQAPERLFGSLASAARTATERLGEVALVVTLAIFMLMAYERFEERLARLEASGRTWRWRGVDRGLADGARGARRIVGRSVVLGAVTAVVALAAGAPAPVALGLWLAWWRLLPVLGIALGYAPLLLLLVAEGKLVETVAAAVVLAAAEAMGWWWSSRQGPGWTAAEAPKRFLSAAAFFGGFELGGVTGASVAVVLVARGGGPGRRCHDPAPAGCPPGGAGGVVTHPAAPLALAVRQLEHARAAPVVRSPPHRLEARRNRMQGSALAAPSPRRARRSAPRAVRDLDDPDPALRAAPVEPGRPVGVGHEPGVGGHPQHPPAATT